MIQYAEVVRGKEQYRSIILGKHVRLHDQMYYPQVAVQDEDDGLDIQEIRSFPTRQALVMKASGVPRMMTVYVDPDNSDFGWLLEEVEV